MTPTLTKIEPHGPTTDDRTSAIEVSGSPASVARRMIPMLNRLTPIKRSNTVRKPTIVALPTSERLRARFE